MGKIHFFLSDFITFQYSAANAAKYWKLLKGMEALARNGITMR